MTRTDNTPIAEKFTKTVDIAEDPSYDKFLPVVGTIDMSGHSEYTCTWSFKLKNKDTGDMFWANAENDMLEDSPKPTNWNDNVDAMRGRGDYSDSTSFLPDTFGDTTVDIRRSCNIGGGEAPCLSSEEIGVLANNWP